MGDEAKVLDEVLDFRIPSNQELYGELVPPFDVWPGAKFRFVKDIDNDGATFGFTVGQTYTVFNDEMGLGSNRFWFTLVNDRSQRISVWMRGFEPVEEEKDET